MNTPHLSTDELDEILATRGSERATSHVATCAECAALVHADRELIAALATLPSFAVAPDFADQVMARIDVAVPVAAASPGLSSGTTRSLAARRRAIGALLLAGGGIAAGFFWASAHPADALRWSSPALENTGHTLWLSLQTLVANTTEQPWFASLRDTLATPLRGLLLVTGAAAAYAIGLVGLRRLMTEPATNASW